MKRMIAVALMCLPLAACDKPLRVDLSQAASPTPAPKAAPNYQIVAAPKADGLPGVWRIETTSGALWYCNVSPVYGPPAEVKCAFANDK